MSNVTIELNSAGVRELLQSAAIRAAVMEAAAGVCARADTRLRHTRQRSERLRE